jgi:hypothetical protein
MTKSISAPTAVRLAESVLSNGLNASLDYHYNLSTTWTNCNDDRHRPVTRRSTALPIPDLRPIRDALIAATPLIHGMMVVTRNVPDFQSTGVPILNPWDHSITG